MVLNILRIFAIWHAVIAVIFFLNVKYIANLKEMTAVIYFPH